MCPALPVPLATGATAALQARTALIALRTQRLTITWIEPSYSPGPVRVASYQVMAGRTAYVAAFRARAVVAHMEVRFLCPCVAVRW